MRPLRAPTAPARLSCPQCLALTTARQRRHFQLSPPRPEPKRDPRLDGVGHDKEDILDDYANIRDSYATPKNPIVLAHGLLGFSVLNAVPLLPPIHYWRGITTALDALLKPETPIITPAVPPSGSIDQRAEALAEAIAAAAPGRPVNIIAHSMGGLDARCMISSLTSKAAHPVRVASLTTIATPRASPPPSVPWYPH
jgi:triacylglycerol lipase